MWTGNSQSKSFKRRLKGHWLVGKGVGIVEMRVGVGIGAYVAHECQTLGALPVHCWIIGHLSPLL